MSKDEVLELLRNLHFLHDIDLVDLDQLASLARSRQLHAGEVVFREGDVINEIYLVHSGKVALEICAPSVGCKRILTAGEGDLLGWSPLLGGTALTATARTLTPTQVVAIDAQRLLALCEDNPSIGYDFMRRIAQELALRLNATRLQLLDIFGTQMPAGLELDAGEEGGVQ